MHPRVGLFPLLQVMAQMLRTGALIGITTDASGSFYVTEPLDNKIKKVSPTRCCKYIAISWY